jgi:hypothetical protein
MKKEKNSGLTSGGGGVNISSRYRHSKSFEKGYIPKKLNLLVRYTIVRIKIVRL